MIDVIIIGGGVAGLSAAINGVQLGLKTFLIEAGNYPAHKVCGEFFSPECLAMLEQWGITIPKFISQATIFSGDKNFSLKLPEQAGSMSRFYFDDLLAKKALEVGVQLLTSTLVTGITRDAQDEYFVTLSSGEIMKSRRLIIGTGRIAQLLDPSIRFLRNHPGRTDLNPVRGECFVSPSEPKKCIEQSKQEHAFYGFKAHFKNINTGNEVIFQTFPGVYLGISAIEDGTTNVACLASIDQVNKFSSPQAFIKNLVDTNPSLKIVKNGTQLFDWLVVQAPTFGIKNMPDLPNVFFIGDAAGTIPPAAGDGLALGLLSGKLVAQYVLKNDAKGFKKAWLKNYASVIRYGKLLHMVMMHPMLAKTVILLCQIFPGLARHIFEKTRIKA